MAAQTCHQVLDLCGTAPKFLLSCSNLPPSTGSVWKCLPSSYQCHKPATKFWICVELPQSSCQLKKSANQESALPCEHVTSHQGSFYPVNTCNFISRDYFKEENLILCTKKSFIIWVFLYTLLLINVNPNLQPDFSFFGP